MNKDIIQEAELLKKELIDNLIPVNLLLIKAKELGLSICVYESWGNPIDSNQTNAPQVSIKFSIDLR